MRASPLWVTAVTAGVVHLLWMIWQFPLPLDFPMLWDTGRHLWAHEPAYRTYDVAIGPSPVSTNNNLPHTHLLLGPLVWLPMEPARLLWQVVSLAGLFLAIRLVYRRPLPVSWIAALLWCGGGTVLMMLLGQLGGVLALAVSFAWREVECGRPRRAAAWIGLLAVMKPFIGIAFVWFAWRREWGAIVSGASVGLAVLAVGVLFFTPAAYVDWWRILPITGTTYSVTAGNGSWQGFVTRNSLGPGWLAVGWIAVAVITVRALAKMPRPGDQLLSVLLAGILLSPIAWAHYLCLVAGPLAHWLHRARRLPVLAWLLWTPALVIVIGQAMTPPWLVASLYTYGFLGLWLGVVSSSAVREGGQTADLAFHPQSVSTPAVAPATASATR